MVKRKKHPDAPKAALGPYMYFCQAQREKVKSEMPEISNKEVLRELGSRWRGLSDGDKKPYEEQAAKDKERFNEEKEEFLKTHASLYVEDNGSSSGGKKKKKKDPNAPKRPRSAYLLYISEKRPEVAAEGGMKQTEIMSKVAKMWNELEVSEKEKYYIEAKKEKEEYEIKLKEYKETLKSDDEEDEDEE